MRKATRISLALGTSAALLSLSALPASAVEGDEKVDSVATVAVEQGYLSITADPIAPFASDIKPGTVVDISVPNIKVVDERALAIAGWTTSFTLGTFEEKPKENVIDPDPTATLASFEAQDANYASELVTWTVNGAESAGSVLNTRVGPEQTAVVTRDKVQGNNIGAWDANVSLTVPANAVAATYEATLTHSVI